MKTKTICILKTDGTHELKTVPVGAGGSVLPALNEAVGGFIETVFLPHFKGQVYANEEGLLVGLPRNPWGEKLGYAQPLVGNLVAFYSGRDFTPADLDKLVPAPAQKVRTQQATRGFY